MTLKKLNNFLQKNLWVILLLIFSLTGITFGIWGFFKMKLGWSDIFYETMRLFVINPSGNLVMSWQLEWARWLILATLLWFSFRLFFLIIAPQFVMEQSIKLFFRNHIIICGLNDFTFSLVNKFRDKKVIVLAKETNKYGEYLKTKNISLMIGDFTDEEFLKKTKILKASQVYAVTESDHLNVEISQTIYSLLERKKRTEAIQCFTLINDLELKTFLEETALFKYKAHSFSGTIFNINKIGIKYGLFMNIDKILPKKIEVAPSILLIGLTEKTEIILLNLLHCLTMNREIFNFTIVEKDTESIKLFKKKFIYLDNPNEKFANIIFVEEIQPEKQYNSIIICTNNPVEAIKQAISIRYLFAKNEPNILVFCDNSYSFTHVFDSENNKKEEIDVYSLKNRNIILINLFEEITNYVFDLESDGGRKIEEKAKQAHSFWNEIYNMDKKWDALSGHFKQSNRNQVLDNYLKTFIAFGEKFEKLKNHLISFSDKDKETLAIMEHRRWVLEKYESGWTLGVRNDEFKKHDCLISWDYLSVIQQRKDKDAVDLMVKLLSDQ